MFQILAQIGAFNASTTRVSRAGAPYGPWKNTASLEIDACTDIEPSDWKTNAPNIENDRRDADLNTNLSVPEDGNESADEEIDTNEASILDNLALAR